MATKAAAAALGWGGRSTGGFGGTARTPRGALHSAVEKAPALARRLPVPQCSAGHVRPAAGEMGARCSRVFGTAAAAENSSSAFHRATRHVQRAHCARLLARGNKTPDARSEVTAHCGKMDTGVRRAGVVTAGHSRAAGEAEAGAPRKWRAPALRNNGARATRTISRASVAKKTTHRVDECGRQGAHGKLPRFLLHTPEKVEEHPTTWYKLK